MKVVRSPNWSPRYGATPDIIVLHYTATGPNSGAAVARFFSYPSAKVSAHEVIDTDGTRYHCVDWSLAAWHAGTAEYKGAHNINSRSLGIEIVNRGDKKTPWPRKQLRSVAKVMREMAKKYPKCKYRIVDHEMVNQLGKTDLKSDFPIAQVMWYYLHPLRPMPSSPYAKLPKWAQQVCDDIKAQKGHIQK